MMGFKNKKIKLVVRAKLILIGIGQIISPTNNEIAVRLLFGSIFVLFGIYIQFGVTSLKRAENALKGAVIKAEDEKNKTKEIIEAIGEGIILQDTDYKIIYQNQIQNEIYGNHVGEYCFKVYKGKDIICEDCPIEASFIDRKTDISKDLWTISGDATQLRRIIMNLCVNARDAILGDSILSIYAENLLIDEDYARMNSEDKICPYIVFTVSDTGTGIPPKISEVGKGTIFKVYLPAITTSETLKAQEHRYKLPAGHGESILVVDDEEHICEITKKTLEKHGYEVITACDGNQAITLYSQHRKKIKLILMDMMMPVMDGSTSIREIRKINPEVKIIAVSGLAEKDKFMKVADLANAFLSKPYTTEKLLKTIHEVLNMK